MGGDQPSPRKRGRYRLHLDASTSPAADAGSRDGGRAMSAFRNRPTRTGRIARPSGPFALRPGIPMPGAMPVSDAAGLVMQEWERQVTLGQISAGTLSTHSAHVKTLVKYAERHGAAMVCDLTANVLLDWCEAANAYTGEPVPQTTQYARRAVASSFFVTCFTLGITDNNPTQSLPSRGQVKRYVHPFTAQEIQRLKDMAAARHKETKGPAALALVLLGCSSGEVGAIRCKDVHLLDRLVQAHGGGERYPTRWLPIDDPWCFDKLAARVRAVADKHPSDWQERPLCYTPQPGTADDMRLRAAATSRTVSAIIARAGLKENGVNRVASIAEYVARRVFDDTGRIEAVAARLGLKSLDDAALICGFDWNGAFAQAGPEDDQ